MQLISFFIDQVAPRALQEALHADNIASVPGSTGVKWASAHFVKTKRVGTKFVIHLVRRDDVF